MPRPSVSAIITAYNSAEFLRGAIESVLQQTQPVDEILVVDDGSTDESARIAAEFAGAGVRYVYQANQGASAARNLGIRSTTGEIIAFLDADDLWQKDKTRLQLDYLSTHPEVGVVSGHKIVWRTDEDEQTLDRYGGLSDATIRTELLINNVVGNPSMTLIRRSIQAQTGLYDPGLRWGGDWEFWIRVSKVTRFGFVPEPVIIYRSHGGNITHQDPMVRLDFLLGISRRAIAQADPAWLRPFWTARAVSKMYYFRANAAFKRRQRVGQQVKYSFLALLISPFDNSMEKLKLFVQVWIRLLGWHKPAPPGAKLGRTPRAE